MAASSDALLVVGDGGFLALLGVKRLIDSSVLLGELG